MKRLNLKAVRKQAGVTILEFVAFIGLAALVIAGALGLYNTANTGAKAKELFEAASGVAATVRQVAAGSTPSKDTVKNVVAPKGWGGKDGTFTKTGDSSTQIVVVTEANDFKVTLDCSTDDACKQNAGKVIGNASGTYGNGKVVWDNIKY